MGKTFIKSFEVKILQEIVSRTEYFKMILKKVEPKGLYGPTPGQYTCLLINLLVYSTYTENLVCVILVMFLFSYSVYWISPRIYMD